MKLPNWTALRPVVLMVGAMLASTGSLPADATAAIVEHAEFAVSAVLGLWSVTAFLRNRNGSAATK